MLEVAFQLVAPLAESEPSPEFVQVIKGEIRDAELDLSLGRISALLVQVGRVADAGEDLFEVMDGESANSASTIVPSSSRTTATTRIRFGDSSSTFSRWICSSLTTSKSNRHSKSTDSGYSRSPGPSTFSARTADWLP